jgi:hypothetical protein
MSADHAARQTTARRSGERPEKDWAGAEFARLGQRIHDLVDDLMRGILDAFVAASPVEISELIRARGATYDWDGTSWRFERVAEEGSMRAPHAALARPIENSRLAPSARSEQAGAEERRPPSKPNITRRAAVRNSVRGGTESFEPIEAKAGDARSPLGSHDPFDITSPGELLASAGSRTTTGETFDLTSPKVGHSAARFEDSLVASATEPSKPDDAPSTLAATTSKQAHTDGPVVAIDPSAASERRPRVVLREGERLLSATGSGVVIRRARR